MQKLSGAIIGCGAIACEHLAALADKENARVAAVCDISAARAEAIAERYAVDKWYTNYKDLLEEVRPNLVHVTTPPASHFTIAKHCLASGYNVFCEKPITVKYEEFCELKRLAEENNCLLVENQNYRFHSSIMKISDLLSAGKLGDIVDVQIFLSLNVFAPDSPYVDQNAPHFGTALRGGLIGDFLTHIAYLAYIFAGPVVDLRTTWTKRVPQSPWAADEFRSFIKGEKATAYVAFSGSAQPDGFWIRVHGTKMQVEANLFEPPRLTLRRLRTGEPALAKVIDGVAEAYDVLKGSTSAFWRKIGGSSRYDGLPTMIDLTYRALEKHAPAPISLREIDEIARVVDRFSKPELSL